MNELRGAANIRARLHLDWRPRYASVTEGFRPVIGPLDDVVVVALALRYASRQVPREVLLAAWPGQPRPLERLLGPPRRAVSEPES